MNSTLTLNNYIVKILSSKDDNFSYLIDVLNTKEYPRHIIETLEVIDGIRRIQVYDKNNNLLMTSSLEIL